MGSVSSFGGTSSKTETRNYFNQFESVIETATMPRTKISPNGVEGFNDVLQLAIRHQRGLYAIVIICKLITGALPAVNAYFYGLMTEVIRTLKPGDDFKQTDFFTYFLLLLSFDILSQLLSVLPTAFLRRHVSVFLRRLALEGLLQKKIEFYDEFPSGQLLSKVMNGISAVEALVFVIPTMIGTLSQIVYSTALAFRLNWKFSLIALCVIPPQVAIILISRKYRLRNAKMIRETSALTGGFLGETVRSMRIVFAYVIEGFVARRFKGLTKRWKKIYKDMLTIEVVVAFVQSLVNQGVTVAFFLIAFDDLTAGLTSGQDIITVYFSANSVQQALQSMLGLIPDLIKNQALAKDAYQLLGGLKIEDLTHKDSVAVADPNVRGEIEFHDVSFAYDPQDEGNLALRNASFKVGPGQHIALVGSSGAGKSTILGIILRLYEGITGGKVTFDGTDIFQLDKKWLRSQMAIVTQEQVLFSGSIKENIALGNDQATMEEIEAASRLANAHSFIVELPLGYMTPCGESGIKLSGGQRQRICIARALLRKPKILLLDEPTSALDNESEKEVQKTLENISQSVTTISITHRLHTVKQATCIYAMHRGQIIESGTHDELMQRGGLYFALSKLGEIDKNVIKPQGDMIQSRVRSGTL